MKGHCGKPMEATRPSYQDTKNYDGGKAVLCGYELSATRSVHLTIWGVAPLSSG